MNKKGIELAISTLILLIIGVVVLIAVVLVVRNGFLSLDRTRGPIDTSTQVVAVLQACRIACDARSAQTYCCTKFTLGNKNIYCSNSTLGFTCPNVDCTNTIC